LFKGDELDMTTKLKRVNLVLGTRLFRDYWLNMID